MKWVLSEPDAGLVSNLSDGSGFHPLIARLMANRGIADRAAAAAFLDCDLSSLSGPGIFAGMEAAVGRIRTAIAAREKIAVYGDYDVDGVTGSALLFLTLKDLGANVSCYIPDRAAEGYGLHVAALDSLKAAEVSVVITIDCGITALDEALHARSRGLDLIITDHHEFSRTAAGADGKIRPEEVLFLPEACAVLHPALLNDDTPDRIKEEVSGLTGVGVAFKLAQALLDACIDNHKLASYLDLVALGTIADVGVIRGENRVLIRHGLDALSSVNGAQRPGIAALKQVARLEGKKIGVGAVGFTLAPRINASGRIERAEAAFRLLTTDSPDEARELADALDAVNRERQSVEEAIQAEAKSLCGRLDIGCTGAIVLASESWHPGVIGIVASRIVEEFYRPTALISFKDGIGKASARSIPGFDLHHGLSLCKDLLIGFGGHKYAAGFTIAEKRIGEFRDRFGSIVLELMGTDGFVRTLLVDGAVTLEELTFELLHDLERMAPFGQGNPEPRLGARAMEVLSIRVVGNNHLKLLFRQEGGQPFSAIAFNGGRLVDKRIRVGTRVAAVFTPRINVWNGRTAVELEIRDLKIDTEIEKVRG